MKDQEGYRQRHVFFRYKHQLRLHFSCMYYFVLLKFCFILLSFCYRMKNYSIRYEYPNKLLLCPFIAFAQAVLNAEIFFLGELQLVSEGQEDAFTLHV